METYTISNDYLKVSIIEYGARIQSLLVKKDNKWIDVVLGYDTLDGYQNDKDTYFGAVVGRVANRIENGTFVLNGKRYHVAINNNTNHLHGGKEGFDQKNFKITSIDKASIKLALVSNDNEENYPGNLSLEVTYKLIDNRLVIIYDAISDKDTLCNITNHSYFNLNGYNGKNILNHQVKLNASFYTPIKENLIPTGKIESVSNSPFDFTKQKSIKEAFDFNNTQIKYAKGIDHNFVLDSSDAGYVIGDISNIKMQVKTTYPGMQFYTGNYLNIKNGKNNASYLENFGFCLETQLFPNAINQSNFKSSILKANTTYHYETEYIFS